MTPFADLPNARSILRGLSKQAAAVQAGAAPVPSPCVSVCRLDPSNGWCEGCLRTLDEIGRWGGMGDDAKRAVWQRLVPRIAAWQAQLDDSSSKGSP